MRYEFVGDDVFVLDTDAGVVHRVCGDPADQVRDASDEVSRRRALKLALAAGVGVTTMALPAAAAASSGVNGSGGIEDSGGVAPDAPTGLSATEGDGQVVLNWTAPTSGTVPTSYTVTRTETYGSAQPVVVTVSAPVTTLTVTGLTNNRSYAFTLVATAAGLSSSSVQVTAVPSTPAPAVVSMLTKVLGTPTAVLVQRSPAPPAGEVDYFWLDDNVTGKTAYGTSTSNKSFALTKDNHILVIQRVRTSDLTETARATITLVKRKRKITPGQGVQVMKIPSSEYRSSQLKVYVWGALGGRGGNAGSYTGGVQTEGRVAYYSFVNVAQGDVLTFAPGSGGENGLDDRASAQAGTGGGAGGTNAFGGYGGGRGGHVGTGFTVAGGGGGGGAASVFTHLLAATSTTKTYVANGSGGGGGAYSDATTSANGSAYTLYTHLAVSSSSTTGGNGEDGAGKRAGAGGGGGSTTGGAGGTTQQISSSGRYIGLGGRWGLDPTNPSPFNLSSASIVDPIVSASKPSSSDRDGFVELVYYEPTSVVQSV